MAENEILTKQGKIDLEKKLQNLVNVEKPKALADLNLARSQGDLSENADYDAAREKTQEIESEINQIQYTLDHATVIENENKDGSKSAKLGGDKIYATDVENGKKFEFFIVGSAEADPANGKISNTCPVALAILGHAVGDVVTVAVKKPYQLKINKIGD
jgi:transcription elongation factor GreA